MTSRRLLTPLVKHLLDAADYLEEHGHCKDRWSNQQGAKCLLGAIHAGAGSAGYQGARDRVIAYLGFRGVGEAVDWNNAPERTADEVIAALRGAALSIPDQREGT